MLETITIITLGVGAFILGFGFHLLIFRDQDTLN
jgi:hypothetical protein